MRIAGSSDRHGRPDRAAAKSILMPLLMGSMSSMPSKMAIKVLSTAPAVMGLPPRRGLNLSTVATR